MKYIFTLLICFIISFATIAQPVPDVKNMSRSQLRALTAEQLMDLPFEDLMFVASHLGISIDDLLDASTTVSSKKAMSARETPGIISVITRQDIQNSGAQDLADLLRTIPGIYFGYDVDGVSGIFMRGNWGHEGKVLFLIDEMELNENMYSVTHLINHIPASQISRIEVIRGPGSALYGGYAELGVIKISTLTGEEMQGGEVSAVAGSFGSGLNRNAVNLNTGGSKGNSSWALMGSWSNMDAAKGDFYDFNGDHYNLQNGWLNSSSIFLNARYKFKQLETQVVYDDYSIVPTGNDELYDNRFRNFFAQTRYSFQAGNKLTIVPSLFYKHQTPYWFENHDDENLWYYKRNSDLMQAGADLLWSLSARLGVSAGAGYRLQNAQISEKEQQLVGETFYNDKFNITHHNTFLYSQISYNSSLGNLFAGARAEQHSLTGLNIAPRVGYTRIFNRFNLKYLYSHAFRSPSFENVNINPDIKVEKTVVNELAIGYRLSNNYFVSVNLFDIVIKDPIVYFVEEEEYYINDTPTGTSGLEAEFKAIFTRWNAGISWSYFNASYNNKSDIYKVILPSGEMPALMKGAPAHMIHFNTQFKLRNRLHLSPVLSWYSPQYGYISSEEEQSKANAYLLADLNLMMNHIWIKNLTLGLSGRNLFNASYHYIQPVAIEGFAERPLPGRPLEVLMYVKYAF
jgi:outer membrane cobalamin receptor